VRARWDGGGDEGHGKKLRGAALKGRDAIHWARGVYSRAREIAMCGGVGAGPHAVRQSGREGASRPDP
jgi:hypothetical protein